MAVRLLRVEEQGDPHRDHWGCWEYPFAESFRNGKLGIPELDVWVAAHRRRLQVDWTLEPVKPDSRQFAVCLTHDVDMISRQMTPCQALRGVRTAFTANKGGQRNTSRTLERILRAGGPWACFVQPTPSTAATIDLCLGLEKEYGVTASYFFTVFPTGNPSPTTVCTVWMIAAVFVAKATGSWRNARASGWRSHSTTRQLYLL